jgi:hypothetical protein
MRLLSGHAEDEYERRRLTLSQTVEGDQAEISRQTRLSESLYHPAASLWHFKA